MSKPTILTVDDDPHGLGGDHPRPAQPVRRRLPRRPRHVRAPRPRRADRAGPARRAGGPDRRRPADAADDRDRDARAGPGARARARSSCCSPRTPTPTSRSRRSTTSASTTTCSSRGTRPRSGSTRSSTTCSTTGGRRNPDHTSDVRVVGHRWSERSHEIKTFLARNHVPYRWYDVERDAEGQRLARARRAPRPTTCRWCWCPTARPLRSPIDARARRRARAAHQRRSSRSTTCASSAAGRPGWRPRCTPRRRG